MKEHIGWKNKHYREYHKLKTLRVDEAHPEVTDGELREAIDKACCDDIDLKNVCDGFLVMLQKIQSF